MRIIEEHSKSLFKIADQKKLRNISSTTTENGGTYAAGLALFKGISREEIGLLPMGKRLLKLFPEKDGQTPSDPS